MATGTVKWFNAEKGYGFISRPDGDDVFVHHSNIVAPGYRSLEANQPVAFELQDTPRGQQAVSVTLQAG